MPFRTSSMGMRHLQARGSLPLGVDETRRCRPQPAHLWPEGREQAVLNNRERNHVDTPRRHPTPAYWNASTPPTQTGRPVRSAYKIPRVWSVDEGVEHWSIAFFIIVVCMFPIPKLHICHYVVTQGNTVRTSCNDECVQNICVRELN